MDLASHARVLVRVVLVIVPLCIAGCGTSEPSRFYLLKAAGVDSTEVSSPSGVRIGLRPFHLPEYLLRYNVVSMLEGNRVDIAEYDRWAEGLDASLSRVMADNLSRMVSEAAVYHYPWRRDAGVQLEVSGEVLQFGLDTDGNVRMVVHWTLGKAGLGEGTDYRFVFARPPSAPGIPGTVDMMNQALTALCEAIAGEISQTVKAPG